MSEPNPVTPYEEAAYDQAEHWRERALEAEAKVEELSRRLYPPQGAGYASEVERLRNVVDELTRIAKEFEQERNEAVEVIRKSDKWPGAHRAFTADFLYDLDSKKDGNG